MCSIFFFVLGCLFFLFSHLLFFKCRVFFAQIPYLVRSDVPTRYLFGTARLATTLLAFPVQGQVRQTLPSKFGRVCLVSRVHVPCVVRHVFFFQRIAKQVVRMVQIHTSLCATLDLGTWVRAPVSANKLFSLPFIFVCFLFFLFFFFIAFHIICVFGQSAPWIPFVIALHKRGTCKSFAPKNRYRYIIRLRDEH